MERELKMIKLVGFHTVRNFGKYDACTSCGRKAQASNDLRTRKHQWAPVCQPLPTFQPFLDKGHELLLNDGAWSRGKCDRMGKWLVSQCDQPHNPAGHAIVRYPHADACHICGHFTLHASKAVQAKKRLGQAVPPGSQVPQIF